jgi:hypothetical protein
MHLFDQFEELLAPSAAGLPLTGVRIDVTDGFTGAGHEQHTRRAVDVLRDCQRSNLSADALCLGFGMLQEDRHGQPLACHFHLARVRVQGLENGILKRHHRAGEAHDREQHTHADAHQPMGLKPKPALSHALATGWN